MRLYMTHRNNEVIYPGDRDQVYFWTRKWGISGDQLNEAIIETGSIRIRDIKKYLIRKGFIFSIFHLLEKIKGCR